MYKSFAELTPDLYIECRDTYIGAVLTPFKESYKGNIKK